MKTIIQRTLGGRLGGVLLLSCVLLHLSTLYLSAQSASDFTVTATPTESTCLQNGQVEITVTKKPGTPTNYTYKAYYDLRNSKDQSVTSMATFVTNNVIANLYPGTYKAYVRLEVNEGRGVPISLDPVSVTVTSTYKTPSLKVNVIRKSLNHYRPNGSTTDVPTGILGITVTDGNGPYTLTFTEAPADYVDRNKTFSLTKGTELKLHRVPKGTYKIKVTDACGILPVQTIEMTNVAKDLPNNSDSDMGLRKWARMTEDMRLNHCGWIYLPRAYSSSSAASVDLIPYFSSLDTFSTYYEYAWNAPSEAKQYRKWLSTPPPFGATNYGADHGQSTAALYYKFPEGKNYKAIGQGNDWPLVYFKVEGSPEEMPKGYCPINYNYSSIDVDYTRNQPDPCDPEYQLGVKPRGDYDVLMCYPITVTVQSLSDPSDTQVLVLDKDSSYTYFPRSLRLDKSYKLTSVAGNGQTVSTTIAAVSISYYVYGSTSSDACTGRHSVYVYLYRTSPGAIPLKGHKIRFVSAPEGFVPNEGALAVGETYELPENYTSNYVYPFSPKSSISSTKYQDNPPVGDYVFEIIDPCDVTYKLTYKYSGTSVTYAGNKSRFTPRTATIECGRVRIYPFAGGVDGLLTKNGVSVDPFLRVTSLPTGISSADIRTNIPSSDNSWRNWTVIKPRYTGLKPEDIYIDFPATEGEVELSLSTTDAGSTYSCLPKFKVPLKNPPLTYERDTYVGYSCPANTSGLVHITPLNAVGDVTIDVYKVGNPTRVYHFERVDKVNGIDIALKGTRESPIPTIYRIIIKDEACQNTAEERIPIYSLASSSVIRTVGQQRKFCEGDPIEMSVINLGKSVVYEWILPSGEKRQGRTLSIDRATPAHSGSYRLKVTNVLCDDVETTIEIPFNISVAPRELWWRQDAQDQNWHNLNNWSRRDGTSVSAVPAPCTVVHLPAKVDKAYPDLSARGTDRSIFGDPECSDIYFHYGAQLGEPQLLSYERAFVDYNFGRMERGGVKAYQQPGHTTADSKLLDRDRWYMLATPLNNMMSGDFSMAGYPKTYQRYIKVGIKSENVTDVTFSKPFDSMVQLFTPPTYYHALALKVAGWQSGVVGYDDHKNLNLIEGIMRLPFFEDATRASAYPLHSYDATSGQSTFRYYNEETLAPLAFTEQANRGKGIYPYRFIYERYNSERPAKSAVSTINLSGVTVPGYEMTVSSALAQNEYFMVGNPFMAPIDFQKLWEANKQTIYPYYYVFENNQWRMYSAETPAVSTRGKEIAPLQAILLRRKSSGGAFGLLFPCGGDQSILLPSWRTNQGGAPVEVRSTGGKGAAGDILPIHLLSDVAGAAPESSAYIYWDAQGDNIPALGNSEYKDAPMLYVLDQDTEEGNIVLYPSTGLSHLQLGVRAAYAAEMTLDFSDIDRSAYEQLTLVDRKTGREQDLLRAPKYRFVHEVGNSGARFVLQLKRLGVPSDESYIDETTPQISLHTSADECTLQTSEAIEQIELYDLSGAMLYNYRATADDERRIYTLSCMTLPKAFILKVTLRGGYTETRKVQL